VFTPTYNRVHTLERAYTSLTRQSFTDFEWLIVDDGSTDGTDELVEQFIKDGTLRISYIYKENGGKHTAINTAYAHAKGKYFCTLDSDDEFLPETLEVFHKKWLLLEEKADYQNFWCVVGLCVDQHNNLVGHEFDLGINDLLNDKKKNRRKLRKISLKTTGEKCGSQKLEIVSKYPFPDKNIRGHIPEGIIWRTIDREYKQYYINDIVQIYWINQSDSLMARVNPYAGYEERVFEINEFFADDILLAPIRTLKLALLCCIFTILCGYSLTKLMGEIKYIFARSVLVVLFPVAYAAIPLFKKRYRIG